MLQPETTSDSTEAPADKHRADWMSKGSFGLMVHYLISPVGNTPEEKTADFNRTVDAFDVSRFVRQFNSTGADWLIFTIGQNTSYYNSPNSFLDARLPGHTPRRDLVLEIATKLKASGKRFIAYMPAELAAPADLHEAFGWRADDPKQAAFQPNYQAFVRVKMSARRLFGASEANRGGFSRAFPDCVSIIRIHAWHETQGGGFTVAGFTYSRCSLLVDNFYSTWIRVAAAGSASNFRMLTGSRWPAIA